MKKTKFIAQITLLIVYTIVIIVSILLLLFVDHETVISNNEMHLLIIFSIIVIPLAISYCTIIFRRIRHPKKIFFSYSSSNEEAASSIFAILFSQLNCSSRHRYDIITADDIPFGANIASTLKDYLMRSDAIIILITSDYLKDSLCIQAFQEIDFDSQTVIPIVLDKLDLLKELPRDISGIRSLCLTSCQTEDELKERLFELSRELVRRA